MVLMDVKTIAAFLISALIVAVLIKACWIAAQC